MMNVYLRAFEPDDYLKINKWRKDPEISKYLGGNVFFVSAEREKKWIEDRIFNDSKQIYLGICLQENGELIGYISINNIDLRNQKAEWGGTLIGEKKYLGKGYGREASILLLQYLFMQFPIHKCYGYCLEEHPASAKLLLSLGFRKDGVLRHDIFKNGEFKDVLLFSILRDEIRGKF